MGCGVYLAHDTSEGHFRSDPGSANVRRLVSPSRLRTQAKINPSSYIDVHQFFKKRIKIHAAKFILENMKLTQISVTF